MEGLAKMHFQKEKSTIVLSDILSNVKIYIWRILRMNLHRKQLGAMLSTNIQAPDETKLPAECSFKDRVVEIELVLYIMYI